MAEDIKTAFTKLNQALTTVNPSVLTAAGEFAIGLISLRTKAGKDADGQRFKTYTPRYKKIRVKKHLRTDPPDLTVTGHMLGSMVPSATGENEVTIEFSSPKEIAKALGNQRTREFFDVRQEAELDAIADAVADLLVAEMVK